MDESKITEIRELYVRYVEELNVTFKRSHNTPINDASLDIIEEVRAKIKTCKEADIGVYGICLVLNCTSHAPYVKAIARSIIADFGKLYVHSYGLGHWWFDGTRRLVFGGDKDFRGFATTKCYVSPEDYAEYVNMWYDIRILFLTKILNAYGRE